jgi:hypothetical protein
MHWCTVSHLINSSFYQVMTWLYSLSLVYHITKLTFSHLMKQRIYQTMKRWTVYQVWNSELTTNSHSVISQIYKHVLQFYITDSQLINSWFSIFTPFIRLQSVELISYTIIVISKVCIWTHMETNRLFCRCETVI